VLEAITSNTNPNLFDTVEIGLHNKTHIAKIEGELVLLVSGVCGSDEFKKLRFIYKIKKTPLGYNLDLVCKIPWSFFKERMGKNKSQMEAQSKWQKSPSEIVEEFGLNKIIAALQLERSFQSVR
jgi:hypothetical protein